MNNKFFTIEDDNYQVGLENISSGSIMLEFLDSERIRKQLNTCYKNAIESFDTISMLKDSIIANESFDNKVALTVFNTLKYHKNLNGDFSDNVSLENYSSVKEIALEGIGDFLSKIWKAIADFFKRIWNWITGNTERSGSISEKIEKVKKETKEEEKPVKEIKLVISEAKKAPKKSVNNSKKEEKSSSEADSTTNDEIAVIPKKKLSEETKELIVKKKLPIKEVPSKESTNETDVVVNLTALEKKKIKLNAEIEKFTKLHPLMRTPKHYMGRLTDDMNSLVTSLRENINVLEDFKKHMDSLGDDNNDSDEQLTSIAVTAAHVYLGVKFSNPGPGGSTLGSIGKQYLTSHVLEGGVIVDAIMKQNVKLSEYLNDVFFTSNYTQEPNCSVDNFKKDIENGVPDMGDLMILRRKVEVIIKNPVMVMVQKMVDKKDDSEPPNRDARASKIMMSIVKVMLTRGHLIMSCIAYIDKASQAALDLATISKEVNLYHNGKW